MKKIENFKKYSIGFLIGISILSVSTVYGASNGSIGGLFEYLSGTENGFTVNNVWRLLGTNIKDNTITSSEIKDGSIAASDITPDFEKRLWDINGNDLYYDTGNVGIGTQTPSSKLDVNGEITAGGLNLRNTFIEKTQPSHMEKGNYNRSCKALVVELPEQVKNHGPCACDKSNKTIDCESKDLLETDQPGCYDLYQSDLSDAYKNEANPDCKDLIADNIKYFELWKLKEKDNAVDAPFVSYDNCTTLEPKSGIELGKYINDKLKINSCINIILNNGDVFTWNDYVYINEGAKVTIHTHNMLNYAQGAKATIKMTDKNTYYYYEKLNKPEENTHRAPGRAYILGTLNITGVKINETINDSRTPPKQSELMALFNIGEQGKFSLTQGEISATEDIVNFSSKSHNGIFETGHEYFYRNPSSVRPELYIVRANKGWGFSGNNGTISWPENYIYLNWKLGDKKATGTGVKKYPVQAEYDKLTYLSNEDEDNNNKGISLFTGTKCSDCPYGSNKTNCKIKDKFHNIIDDNSFASNRCNLGSWSIWSY